ncbi:PREDICTED: monocarboxylate transporter 3-like [Priapulus caudatus]|uniref:Monocarboxylate transporter 3-like n=1 Tax=Priapulus caudatus TaxID=37621 RepID=A0ABM1EPU0_PRICU|nr:PREDICTED: monocarboxylate transporter 3-like [Priapulus caudatus]
MNTQDTEEHQETATENAEAVGRPGKIARTVPSHTDHGWAWMVLIGACTNAFILSTAASSFSVMLAEFFIVFDAKRSMIVLIGSLQYGVSLMLGPAFTRLAGEYSYRVIVMTGGMLATGGMCLSYGAVELRTLIGAYGLLTGSAHFARVRIDFAALRYLEAFLERFHCNANRLQEGAVNHFIRIGFGAGMINSPSKVINGSYFNKKRSLANGLVSISTAVGSLVGPLLCIKLLEMYTWHGTLIILAGIYLQTVAASALFRPIPKAAKETQRKRGSSRSTQLTMPITDLIKLGVHCLSNVAMGVSAFIVMTFWVLYGMSQGFSFTRAAQMMSVLGGSSVLGGFIVAATADRQWFPRHVVFVLATLAISLFNFAFLFARDLWVYALCCVLCGCSVGVRTSMETTILVDLFGIQHLSIVQPIYSLCFGLGAFVGPLTAGTLLDYTDNLKLVVILCGSASAVGAALLSGALYIDYGQKRTRREAPRHGASSTVETIFD